MYFIIVCLINNSDNVVVYGEVYFGVGGGIIVF